MAQKHFVLDTNVLIENPKCITALRNGQENQIYIPYTVLTELDGLKKDPRIGHIVSQAVRIILHDEELHIFPPDFALTLTDDVMDDRILKEILHMAPEEAMLITNDRILQIKAKVYGIPSEEYRDSDPFRSESQRYTGFVEEGEELVNNCFKWENGTPVFHGAEGPKPIGYSHETWGIKPRSIYQNLALELMLQEGIDLISIQSEAGYGKTFLSLAAALYLTLERKDNPYRKIYLVKPVVEIGAKMGYLPGDIEEKMLPYVKYIQDLLIKLHDIRPANRIFIDPGSDTYKLNPKRFEIQPVAFLRGMNIENAVVIVDEMQNLSRGETRALLTRMGEGVKCFCLGDTRQVDHPYLNESNNGLNWTVKKLKGYKNYAHMVLKGDRSRGPITDIVLKSKLQKQFASGRPRRGRHGDIVLPIWRSCFLLMAGFLLFFLIAPARAVQPTMLAPMEVSRFPSLESAIRLKGPIYFCGESVPIHLPEVRERLEKELLLMLWDRAQVILWLKRTGRYFPFIESALAEAGMPDDLKFVAVIESALKPHAGSSRGARGVWQFIRTTGQGQGLTVDRYIDERRNVHLATRAALNYLRELHAEFNSWSLACAAYNMGEVGLAQCIKQQETRNYYHLDMSTETERYVLRGVAAKLIMSNPARYGFDLLPGDYYRPVPFDRVRLKIRHAAPVLVVAKAAGTYYKTIKDMNPQLLNDVIPPGEHIVFLPKGSAKGFAARYEPLIIKHRKTVKGKTYTVRRGDTLTAIARKADIPFWKLLKFNNLNNRSVIRPGQKLIIMK